MLTSRFASRSALVVGGVLAVVAAAVALLGGWPPGGASPPRRDGTGVTRATSAPTTAPRPQPVWRIAWGSAMAWGHGVALDTTVRDLATVGVGGEAVRVRISNVFGNAPLQIAAATVAQSAAGPAVVAGTLRPLAFGGAPGVTVPVGQVAYSDPVPMAVSDMETLAVSLYVTGADLVSLHPCCTKMVSFFAPNNGGNLTESTSGYGLSIASPWERWVDAVDVLQTTGRGSIVVVGDSITDGFNATLSWVQVLQERVDSLPAAEQRAIINEGITANALTAVVHTDSAVGGGPSGLSRLARDALSQAGVSKVVLFLGTNDLWFGATAAQLIAGYQQAIAEVHAAGLKIVAVTLLPRATNPDEPWNAAEQAELVAVDSWIRTSHAFDGVIDLAPVVADVYNGACQPDVLFPPFDSGDHLHPDAAGQTAMADAVPPALLGLPPMPEEPQLVQFTPTPGCDAAQAPA